jgi:hypothetical protein
MNSYFMLDLAKAQIDDLRRTADNARAGRGDDRDPGERSRLWRIAMRDVRRSTSTRRELGRSAGREVTMRFATPADDSVLRRLAQLDSSSVPPPPVLIAEEDGEARAAISLRSSQAITDPFHPTAALVELLSIRAAQIGTRSTARSCEQISPTRHTAFSPTRETA